MSTTTDLSLASAAADAAAELVPSTLPLTAVPAPRGVLPPADAQAVVMHTVGASSAELVIVAADAVLEAVAAGAAAGTPISLEDALRPALEAAADALGPSAHEPSVTVPVGDLLGPDLVVFTLSSGATQVGWFLLRLRSPQVRAGVGGPVRRASIRVLYDVEMTLTAELGRTKLPLRQVLELSPGAVLELDRTVGSPADVMVNGRLIARGEVVVVDEDYGLRITEIVAPPDVEGEQDGEH